MIERSPVRVPAGAVGELSSPLSTFCADPVLSSRPHLAEEGPQAHTCTEGGSTRPHLCRRGFTRPHLAEGSSHAHTCAEGGPHANTCFLWSWLFGALFPAEISVSAFCSSWFENVLSSFLFIWIFRLSFQTSHFLSLFPLEFRQATECSCICCASVETDEKLAESRGTPDLL